MFVNLFLLFIGFNYCTGVIYHLNDSEYERMPPIYSLDKYDSCMAYDEGMYCTAKIQLFSDTSNELMSLINNYSAHTSKHYNHSLIERGICVSKRCQKFIKLPNDYEMEEISEALATCINDTVWKQFGLQTKLLEYNCEKKNEVKHKDIFDYIFLIIISGLLTLNIAGTVCDIIVQRQNLEKNNHHGWKHYLMCFSIIKNWASLTSSEKIDPRLEKLKGLHGVRFVVMYMFIIGHVFYMFHTYIENTHAFEQCYECFWYKLIFNGMGSVQFLFCISGFLLMYHLQLESEKVQITWKTVPKLIALRLWRLTPANFVYVLFSATLLRNWGNGPIWKSLITSKMSGDCRRYWWAHLIFINNYIPDDTFCVVQNWQLAADVQLYILGICIFVATKNFRRSLVFSFVILLGLVAIALHIWWGDLDGLLMLTPEVYRTFDTGNYVVRKFAHVNIPGFMIGMLTGHFLYNMQKEKVDITKYKQLLSFLCNLVITTIIIIFFSGSYFYENAERAPLGLRIAYGIFLPTVLALITSFAILAFMFRVSEFWTNLLEWNGWVIPSRLTYCVSLIHTFFILDVLGSITQLQHVSTMNHTIMYLGITVLSFIFAIPYCLMIEAPFNKLFKAMTSKDMRQVKKEN